MPSPPQSSAGWWHPCLGSAIPWPPLLAVTHMQLSKIGISPAMPGPHGSASFHRLPLHASEDPPYIRLFLDTARALFSISTFCQHAGGVAVPNMGSPWTVPVSALLGKV